MKFTILTCLLIVSSNVVLGKSTSTLTVYLGDEIIVKTSEFKSSEHCGYFERRLNRHSPIISKDGKLVKMKAYCSNEHLPVIEPF